MDPGTKQRKLAAIMFTDVAGNSVLAADGAASLVHPST